jgi:hypothetical protein
MFETSLTVDRGSAQSTGCTDCLRLHMIAGGHKGQQAHVLDRIDHRTSCDVCCSLWCLGPLDDERPKVATPSRARPAHFA